MANKFEKHFARKKVDTITVPAKESSDKIQVGAGLLNEASKMARQKEMDTIFVLPEYIHPSPDNEISMNESEIEELANSFIEVGMINPIMVRLIEENNYRIVCGERRYRAIWININKGLRDKNTPVKCSLFNPDLIDLPLSDDEKEDYVRDVENAQQRNKTDGDKLMLMRKFKARYELLRERDPERFKGVKTRELLSQDMNVSESTVAQFTKVENQGSQALQQAMIDGKVNITTAVDIASMDQKSQEDLISKVLDSGKGEKVTKKDVQQYQFEERNREKKEISEVETTTVDSDPNMVLITDKSFKKELKDILKYLKDKEGVSIHKDDLLTILNKIRDIEHVIKKY